MSWWTWPEVTGALVRRVPAAVIDVSASGCLLETHAPLKPGTVGLLEVDDGGLGHREVVRVCHSRERAGASMPFRAGTEFLVLDAAASPSVRHKAARLEALHASGPRRRAGRRLVTAEEKSGAGRTTPKAGRRAARGGPHANPCVDEKP